MCNELLLHALRSILAHALAISDSPDAMSDADITHLVAIIELATATHARLVETSEEWTRPTGGSHE